MSGSGGSTRSLSGSAPTTHFLQSHHHRSLDRTRSGTSIPRPPNAFVAGTTFSTLPGLRRRRPNQPVRQVATGSSAALQNGGALGQPANGIKTRQRLRWWVSGLHHSHDSPPRIELNERVCSKGAPFFGFAGSRRFYALTCSPRNVPQPSSTHGKNTLFFVRKTAPNGHPHLFSCSEPFRNRLFLRDSAIRSSSRQIGTKFSFFPFFAGRARARGFRRGPRDRRAAEPGGLPWRTSWHLLTSLPQVTANAVTSPCWPDWVLGTWLLAGECITPAPTRTPPTGPFALLRMHSGPPQAPGTFDVDSRDPGVRGTTAPNETSLLRNQGKK